MSDLHPADVALRFIAMYSEVQQAMDLTLTRYLVRTSPSVGKVIGARLRRTSDGERLDAITAIASDVDAADQWQATPGVWAELKMLRDTIGHATLLGAIDGDDGEVRVFAGGNRDPQEFTTEQLSGAYARALWCLEQVIFVAAIAGESAAAGEPHRRRSGAALVAAPPPREPYGAVPRDPIVIWELVPDDTEDHDWWVDG